MVTTLTDDLFSPEVVQDPYTYFARMRDEDPVHWNAPYKLWVISKYKDLVWVTRRPELFSSEVFHRDPLPPYPDIDESDMGLYEYVKQFFAQWFIQHDRRAVSAYESIREHGGPDHTDMRKVIHGYFNPKAMELWRPLVQSAINQLLDEAEERGHMDVMRDYATPLPLLVIAAMMGIETSDRQFIRSLAEKLLFLGRGNTDRMQPLTEGIMGLQEYLRPMVAERIKNPNGDLLDRMTDAYRVGVMDEEQVVANAILLLLAGHETTINLICNGTRAFMTHPDQWELMKADPEGRMIRATEECLRYDPPVKSIQRISGEPLEFGGKQIEKDQRMRWFITGANRDPEVFDRPDDFDIERYPNPHVAFGSGIHHCLGATLARLEGQEAFKTLAQRFPNLNLGCDPDDLTYTSSIAFRTLEQLPVNLT
ncbi:MAG: cytochrome P450 [Dehalococcoidia bacterium]|nr:cytochrome P450 [Dehalococcoidia bacterium]